MINSVKPEEMEFSIPELGIYHVGVKGMRWGYNKGKRNGGRTAEGEVGKLTVGYGNGKTETYTRADSNKKKKSIFGERITVTNNGKKGYPNGITKEDIEKAEKKEENERIIRELDNKSKIYKALDEAEEKRRKKEEKKQAEKKKKYEEIFKSGTGRTAGESVESKKKSSIKNKVNGDGKSGIDALNEYKKAQKKQKTKKIANTILDVGAGNNPAYKKAESIIKKIIFGEEGKLTFYNSKTGQYEYSDGSPANKKKK